MSNPNFEKHWIVLLRVEGSWVSDFGYASGKGAWLSARRFMNVQHARLAVADPTWHNDPDGVRRAKPVKLYLSVSLKPYPDPVVISE